MNDSIISQSSLLPELRQLSSKVFDGKRISQEEGLYLFEKAGLGLLGLLADQVNKKLHGNKVYFNRNFHIEPTNICVFNCHFCSYRRKPGEEGCWDLDIEQMAAIAQSHSGKGATEVHITGGVHPSHDIHFYGQLVQRIKEILPGIHIKAFSAIELDYMIKKAGMTLMDGLKLLKEYGLDSVPGGGAEIFDEEIRNKVCDEKSNAQTWLDVHSTAHKAGLSSNATMLYGHIEKYKHRIDHMSRIRDLQDITHGFNAFIPLKFKSVNNRLSNIGEVTSVEDLRNYAISRIFLDNVPHLKAYWPMIGKETAIFSLSFGVDDLDGTIDDSTKIYSMAGAAESNPSMTVDEITTLIRNSGHIPVERDSLYREIRAY
ncbi:MAG: aminofutalosine synthase MqnE [Bacteroidia bacterium]|nr:aminofutalosine synthase MqnE [Bacteroidia bacterium]